MPHRSLQAPPLYEFSGNHLEIGTSHGEQLRDSINTVYTFYREVTQDIPLATLKKQAKLYQEAITSHMPNVADEIRGIARGSGLELWQVAFLNARSEIMMNRAFHQQAIGECTVIYSPTTKLLAENWDWYLELRDLACVVRAHQADGPALLFFTEPGLVAKVGLNSHGLGVGLSILESPTYEPGVPTHIAIRALLDQPSLPAATQVLEDPEMAMTSSLLIADNNGHSCNYEFSGKNRRHLQHRDKTVIHTNHYLLSPEHNSEDSQILAISELRYTNMSHLATQGRNNCPTELLQLLTSLTVDQGGVYQAPSMFQGRMMGTVLSICLDLTKLSLHIQMAPDEPHTVYTL